MKEVDFDPIIEPSDRSRKSDSGVECLWVSDVTEDPCRWCPFYE